MGYQQDGKLPEVKHLCQYTIDPSYSPTPNRFFLHRPQHPFFYTGKISNKVLRALVALQSWCLDARRYSFTPDQHLIQQSAIQTIFVADAGKIPLGRNFFEGFYGLLDDIIHGKTDMAAFLA